MGNRQIEQADAVAQLQSFNERLRFLHTISQEISSKKPLPRLLSEIMESSKLLMGAEASSLLLYDREDSRLFFSVATGDMGELVKQFTIDMGQGIAGWVAQHREPLVIEDCYEDPRFNPEFDKKSQFRTKSMICVPLIRKNELLGVIEVINKRDGSVFGPDDLSLFETLAAHCAIAIENHHLTEKQIRAEALERELETAREIQQHLLPKQLPVLADLDIDTMIIPARMVGGDYYNIIRINDRQTLFFVADVSGKGVPAALIVSIIVACLNSHLLMACEPFDLLGLVASMNRVLIETTLPTRFVTAWFGLYSHDTGVLTSVNAGHNPPYVLRKKDSTVHILEKGGIFLGSMDLPFEAETIQLEPSDIVLYYTDGVTEAWNTREEDYGEDRLITVLKSKRSASAGRILKAIKDDVQRHVGDAEPSDDLTCGVILKR
ncbi:SpoIIE family protein phosphatase [bacterium]|nr:SpoIIE family protein phosphatase [bacterium]